MGRSERKLSIGEVAEASISQTPVEYAGEVGLTLIDVTLVFWPTGTKPSRPLGLFRLAVSKSIRSATDAAVFV